MKFYDVCIIGGGHSGLVAALAFAKNNFRVLCVESKTISTSSKKDLELRTTAHLLPTVSFLKTIGVWKHLEAYSCPLETLKIINEKDIESSSPKITNNIFQSNEINQNNFGYNVPLEKSVYILRELVKSHENIIMIDNTSLTSSYLENNSRIIQLSNGNFIKTKLVIGADGANSVVRSLSGIEVFEKDTGQVALTFNVKHTLEHKNISNELYKVGGPLTTIPILDDNKNLHSSIVWMNNKEVTEQLLSLNKKNFALKLNERSLSILGEMSPITKITELPVRIMVSQRLVEERIALIGEAAHKLPPIGAQGFNMSVKDIETILQLSIKNAKNIGSSKMLKLYQFKRYPETFGKAFSVGFLNKLAASEQPVFQNLRALGLDAIDNIGPLKQSIMRFGLG